MNTKAFEKGRLPCKSFALYLSLLLTFSEKSRDNYIFPKITSISYKVKAFEPKMPWKKPWKEVSMMDMKYMEKAFEGSIYN